MQCAKQVAGMGWIMSHRIDLRSSGHAILAVTVDSQIRVVPVGTVHVLLGRGRIHHLSGGSPLRRREGAGAAVKGSGLHHFQASTRVRRGIEWRR